MSKPRILVIESDLKYLRPMQINLTASGYEVIASADETQAVKLVAFERPDLVVLGLLSSGVDGLDVCRHIREFSHVPIIIIGALADDSHKVQGLNAGADDYLTKPFSMQELLARVRALLRRARLSGVQDEPPVFVCGELKVDFVKRRVFVRGYEVALTPTEYNLLCAFVRNAKRVLTPTYLLQTVWGTNGIQNEQLVWQAVHRLRRKIEPDPQRPIYVHNRPGIGYYFDHAA